MRAVKAEQVCIILFFSMSTGNPATQPDTVNSYAMRLLHNGLFLKSLFLLCKSPDRNRCISLLKFIMLHLYEYSTKSKYAREIVRFLTQHQLIFSLKKSMQVFYGLFVNKHGTHDSFVPADLEMEFAVKEQKKLIKHMYAGCNEASIIKRSCALSGLGEVSSNYDCSTDVISRKQHHRRADCKGDEMIMLQDLRSIRPLVQKPGRKHTGFRAVSSMCLRNVNKVLLKSWMDRAMRECLSEIGK